MIPGLRTKVAADMEAAAGIGLEEAHRIGLEGEEELHIAGEAAHRIDRLFAPLMSKLRGHNDQLEIDRKLTSLRRRCAVRRLLSVWLLVCHSEMLRGWGCIKRKGE